MRLRTITLWAIYRPKFKHIIHSEPTKKALKRCHVPADCVVVKMKGHYLPPRTPNRST